MDPESLDDRYFGMVRSAADTLGVGDTAPFSDADPDALVDEVNHQCYRLEASVNEAVCNRELRNWNGPAVHPLGSGSRADITRHAVKMAAFALLLLRQTGLPEGAKNAE